MSQEVTYEKTDGCLPCSSSGNDACDRLWDKGRPHKAYLTVKFDDTKTYSDFNDETLYQGSVVEAVADGYTFPEHFYPVKDGKLKKKATDKNIDGDDSYKVVITSESIDVAVSGKVAYVSGNNVKIKDEKTVSIQKENADDTSLTYIVYK